jgi:hypothetical protein
MTRSTFLLLADFERLEEWSAKVRSLAHEQPYLVGSVNTRPDYRDVDVRIILDDARFDAAFGGWDGKFDPRRVRYLNRALSAWGQRETGLPLDVQIQRRTEANAKYDGERNAMGTRDWRTILTSGVPEVAEVPA